MSKKILVTGASGFIASNLISKLLELNYDIVGVDRNPLQNKSLDGKITFIQKDVNNLTIDDLPLDIDYIIHLSATAGVRKSISPGII